MASVFAASAGRACTTPYRPAPRTWRISSSSHGVQVGPAARPSAMHSPIRTASRALSIVLLQPGPTLLSVREQIVSSRRIDALPPADSYRSSAASLSLSRIMMLISCSLALAGGEVDRRNWSAAIQTLIMDAVSLGCASVDEPVIVPLWVSSSAHDQKPGADTVTGAARSSGGPIGGAALAGAALAVPAAPVVPVDRDAADVAAAWRADVDPDADPNPRS